MNERRNICIIINKKDLRTRSKELLQDYLMVNSYEFHLQFYVYNWEYDRYEFVVYHKELPIVPEGQMIMKYDLETAKIKFPYLFFDTNPFLYRKF